MTVDFAKELNREWPSLHLYEEDKLLYQADKTDAFSLEKLCGTYLELRKLALIDDELFSLLQEAFSQVGKQAFQSAIEEGVVKLLGTKSEYFLPILVNTDISAVKKKGELFELYYTFEQLVKRKGEVQHPSEKEKYMVITQPLKKVEGKWVSPEAEIKIAVKKRA